MALSSDEQRLSQRTKVAHVLGEDGSILGSRVVEHPLVGRAGPGRFVNRDDVVAASSQLAGDEARVHLVEQELQEAAC